MKQPSFEAGGLARRPPRHVKSLDGLRLAICRRRQPVEKPNMVKSASLRARSTAAIQKKRTDRLFCTRVGWLDTDAPNVS